PSSARALLREADKRGVLRADEIKTSRSMKEIGQDVRILETRLLAFGDDVHTERGAHVKRIESWEHWAQRREADVEATDPDVAHSRLDGTVATLNSRYGAQAFLPWHERGGRGRRSRSR